MSKGKTNTPASSEAAESKLPKGVTQTQVDAWKRDNKNVQLFTVPGKEDDEIYKCILRGADRKIVSAFHSIDDPIKAKEMLLNALWLAGDEIIKTRDDLFLGMTVHLDSCLQVSEVAVEKL